ncbi:MAG: transglutaminase family protein, partial [Pirellulaceae bacterium]
EGGVRGSSGTSNVRRNRIAVRPLTLFLSPRFFAIPVLLWAASLGCRPSEESSPEPIQPVASTETGTQQTTTQQTASEIVDSPHRETWDVIFIADTKVGYAHTRYGRTEENGMPVEQISSDQRLTIQRFGQTVTMKTRYASWETSEGQLLRFFSEMDDGSSKMTTQGQARGETLTLKTEAAGKTMTTSMPWDASWGGFFATEQQLEREPMQPGECRSFKTLMPVLNQVGGVELEAADYETTDLLDGPTELLRINGKIQLAGTTIESIIWVDEKGEALKTLLPTMNQVAYRTTREIALQEGAPGKFDLGFDTIARVDRPIAQPHETRRVVYRVRLEGGDPAAAFSTGSTQAVQRMDDNTAEITVRAVRPDTDLGDFPKDEPPNASELASSNYLQTDDKRVIAMANAVAQDQADAWAVARQLERHVRESIQTKNFSRALATAADVAANLEGDCTEHAVLLAALCRVRKIPARVAIGLVYYRQAQGFAYHMWTEVWIGDRWIPLDATLGRGGIGAAHLKICHSSLEGTDALGAFLPVLNLMGKLELEIVTMDPPQDTTQPAN